LLRVSPADRSRIHPFIEILWLTWLLLLSSLKRVEQLEAVVTVLSNYDLAGANAADPDMHDDGSGIRGGIGNDRVPEARVFRQDREHALSARFHGRIVLVLLLSGLGVGSLPRLIYGFDLGAGIARLDIVRGVLQGSKDGRLVLADLGAQLIGK